MRRKLKVVFCFFIILNIMTFMIYYNNHVNKYKRSLNNQIVRSMDRVHTSSAQAEEGLVNVLEGKATRETLANLSKAYYGTYESLIFIEGVAFQFTNLHLKLGHYWVLEPLILDVIASEEIPTVFEEHVRNELNNAANELGRIHELAGQYSNKDGRGWDKNWRGFVEEFNEYVRKKP